MEKIFSPEMVNFFCFKLQSISRKSCVIIIASQTEIEDIWNAKLHIKVNAVRMIGNSKHTAGCPNLFI